MGENRKSTNLLSKAVEVMNLRKYSNPNKENKTTSELAEKILSDNY
jgi:hypothetical protein